MKPAGVKKVGDKKVKVLLIDDSALAREILRKGLAGDPKIEDIGTAPDVYVARDKLWMLKCLGWMGWSS